MHQYAPLSSVACAKTGGLVRSLLLVACVVAAADGRGGAASAAGCRPLRRALVGAPTTRYYAAFNAVTRAGTGDAWAVGVVGDTLSGAGIAAHWDGSRWSLAPIPAALGQVGLAGVSGVAQRDVWAVGSQATPPEPSAALILHWDGQRWRRNAAPTWRGSTLTGVVALAADDVWAVGGGSPGPVGQEPLIEHWDGRRWHIVPIGGAPRDGYLHAVSASSPRDIWAVGQNGDDGFALVAHYDGRRWRVVPGPRGRGLSGLYISTELDAVAAVSPADVWAAANVRYATRDPETHVEHWDGRRWRTIPDAPNPVEPPDLAGMAARAADDVWAVGYHIVEHWDGRRWRGLPLPAGEGFGAVAPSGPGTAWLAGGGTIPGRPTRYAPLVEEMSAAACGA